MGARRRGRRGILYELGQRKKHQVLVGFAAETNDLETYARKKLAKNIPLSHIKLPLYHAIGINASKVIQ